MDKFKNFITAFIASPFNKVWLVISVIVSFLVFIGKTKGWFRQGWKKYTPYILLVAAVLVFLAKKFFVNTGVGSQLPITKRPLKYNL